MLREHAYAISPATYYRYAKRKLKPTTAELDDAYDAHRLWKLWVKNRRVYGRRKLWKTAQRQGWRIGRDHVDRLMRILGIRGVSRRKTIRTTQPNPNNPRYADLCKRAWDSVSAPNQWWVADFTYVYTRQGFCYVAFVTDVYSRRILGYTVSKTKHSEFVVDALRQALSMRARHDANFDPVGIIHHSDAGSQYTSAQLRGIINEYGLEGSIGTVGDAYDNGLMESTIGLYKSEEIDFAPYRTFESWREVETATADWVWWYNNQRLHSSIGYLPPTEYEDCYYYNHPPTDAEKPLAA